MKSKRTIKEHRGRSRRPSNTTERIEASELAGKDVWKLKPRPVEAHYEVTEPIIVKPAGTAPGTQPMMFPHTIWEPIAIGLAFGLMISITLYLILRT